MSMHAESELRALQWGILLSAVALCVAAWVSGL